MTAHRHDQVEEFFGTEVRGKPGLVDDIVGEMESDALRQHAARTMRDVRERPAMHDGRRALGGLHEVRQHGVIQQHHHRADRLEVGRRDRCAVVVEAHDDPRQALAEVGAALRQGENGHDLRRRGDHESGFARGPALAPTETGGNAPQRAVVHVHAARPQNFLRIDPQVVTEVQVRVEQRREQVVRRGDGVKVAGEVQVNLVERHKGRLATTGRAALHAEHRAERRLAQRGDGVVSELHQSLRDADGVDGLALTAGRGRDGGDEDQFSPPLRKALEHLEPNLGDGAAVRFEQVVGQAKAGGDLGDGQHKG